MRKFYPASNYSLVIDPLGHYFRTDVSTNRLTPTVKQYEYLSAYKAGVMLMTNEMVYTKDTGLSYDANLHAASTKITAGGNICHTTVSYDTAAIVGVALPNDVSEYQGNTNGQCGTRLYLFVERPAHCLAERRQLLLGARRSSGQQSQADRYERQCGLYGGV